MAAETGHHHRSSLKQRNKPFRRGRAQPASDRGRTDKKDGGAKAAWAPAALSKGAKKALARKSRADARAAIEGQRRIFAGAHGVPRAVVLLGLHPLTDLSAVHPEDTVYIEAHRTRVRFVHAPHGTPALQLAQILLAADTVVLVVAVQHNEDGTLSGLDESALDALAVLRALGVAPDAPVVVQRTGAARLPADAPAHIRAEDSRARRALALAWLDALRPHCVPAERAFTDVADTEAADFARALSLSRPAAVAWRDARPYILPESVQSLPDGATAVVGYVRGAPGGISADRLVSLGGRTYVVRAIEAETPDGTVVHVRSSFAAETADALLSDACPGDAIGQSENSGRDSTLCDEIGLSEDSPMADATLLSASDVDMTEGTADASDDQSEDESEDEDEMRARRRHFPDALSVPPGTVLRERLRRYRGVASLRTADWDARADLPPVFARLHALADYRHSRRIASEEACDDKRERCALPGTRVRLTLDGPPIADLSFAPGVVVGLLRHEQRCVVQSLAVLPRTELANRTPVVAMIGMRPLRTRPVLSEHTPGHAAHKLLRTADRASGVVVATSLLPLTFDPAPALLFDAGTGSLVASGSVLDADARRIVAKRATLTGVPCRVHKRSVVVRHMFSDPADVAYFRPVELVTRAGARGHIRESLGTHGRMKCVFDRTVMQHDIVAMHLYKRVHPKLHGDEEWAY